MKNKRINYILFAVFSFALITGCSDNKDQIRLGEIRKTGYSTEISNISIRATTSTLSVRKAKRLLPLEEAQKSYLYAYNDYVRLLRESGPQTFDTLQALATYQKSYQIYQMLLKAENGG